MKRLFAAAVLVLSVATAGCFQIEQNMSLDGDLSGTADFMMSMDMETMVPFMASMNRTFSGQSGPPTEQDLAQARQMLLSQLEAEPEPDMSELETDLPEGVDLLDATFNRRELNTRMYVQVAFDHVNRLQDLNLDEEGGEDPTSSPWGFLEVAEEGGDIVVRTADPVSEFASEFEEAQEGMGGEQMMGGFQEVMQQMFTGMNVKFTIQAPFRVVEHNATRVEGDRLIWEYSEEDFRAVSEGRGAPGDDIFVRFRR